MPMRKHPAIKNTRQGDLEYLADLGAFNRWSLEVQGVPKRPDPKTLLASVHPKVKKGAPMSKTEEGSTSSIVDIQMEEDGATATLTGPRLTLREWWRETLAGQEHIHMPDLARSGVEHFAADPDFVARFWDVFAYSVIYAEGIDILSKGRLTSRIDPNGTAKLIEEPVEWFERNGRGHVAIRAASDEEWAFALKQREDEIAVAQARLDMLREIRAGVPVVGLRGIPWRNGDRPNNTPPALTIVTEEPPAALPHYDDVPRDVPQGQFWARTDSWTNPNVLILHCPVCAYDYNHHESPIEYDRGEDQPTQTTVRGVPVDAPHPNPSPRRHALGIPMDGECGHTWTLFVVQHKGQTFLWTDQEDAP